MQLVSIIVPVYNVSQQLPCCLDSLVGQTYSELEIIVVNDFSPDNSQEIIDGYCTRDLRIRPLVHEQNKGPGGARNTGIEAATGDYLLFVDADDWLAPDAVEYLVNVVRERQSDIVRFGKNQLEWE